MCLHTKRTFEPNNVEIDLYKAFRLRNGQLYSVYQYDDGTRGRNVPYERGKWHKAYPTFERSPVIVGFHAFVDENSAKRWAYNHIGPFDCDHLIVKVRFKAILAYGIAGDGVSRTYTAMEMYIPFTTLEELYV